MTVRAARLAVLLLVLCFSCSAPPSGDSSKGEFLVTPDACQTAFDCADGQECFEGECVAACSKDPSLLEQVKSTLDGFTCENAKPPDYCPEGAEGCGSKQEYFFALQQAARSFLTLGEVSQLKEVEALQRIYETPYASLTDSAEHAEWKEISKLKLESYRNLLKAEVHLKALLKERDGAVSAGGRLADTRAWFAQNTIDGVLLTSGYQGHGGRYAPLPIRRQTVLDELSELRELGVSVYDDDNQTDYFSGERVDPTHGNTYLLELAPGIEVPQHKYYLSLAADIEAPLQESQLESGGWRDLGCEKKYRLTHVHDAVRTDSDSLRALARTHETTDPILDIRIPRPNPLVVTGWDLLDKVPLHELIAEPDAPSLEQFWAYMRFALQEVKKNILALDAEIAAMQFDTSYTHLLEIAHSTFVRAAVLAVPENQVFVAADCWSQLELKIRGTLTKGVYLAAGITAAAAAVTGHPYISAAIGIALFADSARRSGEAWLAYQAAQKGHLTSVEGPGFYSGEQVKAYQRELLLNVALTVVDGVFTIRQLREIFASFHPHVGRIKVLPTTNDAGFLQTVQIRQVENRLAKVLDEATRNVDNAIATRNVPHSLAQARAQGRPWLYHYYRSLSRQAPTHGYRWAYAGNAYEEEFRHVAAASIARGELPKTVDFGVAIRDGSGILDISWQMSAKTRVVWDITSEEGHIVGRNYPGIYVAELLYESPAVNASKWIRP